jgi:hypothetical protein
VQTTYVHAFCTLMCCVLPKPVRQY